MINMSPAGIYISQPNSPPEFVLGSRLLTYRYSSSGTTTFTANSGSYMQEVTLTNKNYRGNALDLYVVYITPNSASTNSIASNNYIGKKFQLGMALPLNIVNSSTQQRLLVYDILTCKLLDGKLQFQAYNALDLSSSNPITQTSISFNWELVVFAHS